MRTFGCSHNVSDSEYMEGMLAEYGYDLVRPLFHVFCYTSVTHDKIVPIPIPLFPNKLD